MTLALKVYQTLRAQIFPTHLATLTGMQILADCRTWIECYHWWPDEPGGSSPPQHLVAKIRNVKPKGDVVLGSFPRYAAPTGFSPLVQYDGACGRGA